MKRRVISVWGMKMGKLEGNIALITGGTSGIGKASAKMFASEGAEVILVGRNKEKGRIITEEILATGGNAKFIQCDVTQEHEVDELKQLVKNNYGRLDILFNNAGILITSPLEDIKIEDWNKVFNINTTAVMLMTQAFIDMVVKARGNILNCASIDGLDCNIRGTKNYIYSSSKAATIHFTKYCARNYSDKIRVNCICPGVTETPLWLNRDFSRFSDSIPMGRVGQSNEIAKAALFLVSEDASYITGAVLPVDGGAALI